MRGRAIVATAVAFGMVFGPVASVSAKKKNRGSAAPALSVEGAESKRGAVRDSAGGDADDLEEGGSQLGDPLLFIEAADARLEAAAEKRSTETAEEAKEPSRVALDILHFLKDSYGSATPTRWKVVAEGDVSDLIDRAQAQLRRADELVAEIEAEEAAADQATGRSKGEGKKKKNKRRQRDARPGTGMIGAGSALVALGAGGIGLMTAGIVLSNRHQKDAEALMADDEGQAEYDKLEPKGERANLFAYIGAGAAGLGIAVGIPLLVLGVKKRKRGGPSAAASLRVLPTFNGVSLSGRF